MPDGSILPVCKNRLQAPSFPAPSRKAALHFNNCKRDVSNLLPWHWFFFQPLELFYIWLGWDGRLSSNFRLSGVITLCNLFPPHPTELNLLFSSLRIPASVSRAAPPPLPPSPPWKPSPCRAQPAGHGALAAPSSPGSLGRISEGFLYLSAFLRQLFCRLKIYQCQKQTPPPPSQKHHDPEFYLEKQELRVSPAAPGRRGHATSAVQENQAQAQQPPSHPAAYGYTKGFYPYGLDAISRERTEEESLHSLRAGLTPALKGQTSPGEGRAWVNCGTLISPESWREPAGHSGSHSTSTLQY